MKYYTCLMLFFAFAMLPNFGFTQPVKPDDKPLRIGVAGLTHTHVHWILNRAKDGDFEIVGIAEENTELAGRYLDQYGLDMNLLYPTLEEMLDQAKPEAVTAFNSIIEHEAVVELCAPKGIHVMVEKPLAVNSKQAKNMAKLAEKHNILLLTNYETTWYPSNHYAYDLVHQDGSLGNLRKVVVHDGHPGPVAIGINEEFLEWLIDPEKNGGGAITDFGCYGANLITWLMQGQKPTSVMAITQQFQPEHYPDVDDEATIILEYPDMQGIIQASWNWPVSRKDMEVYAEKGFCVAEDGENVRYQFGDDAELIRKKINQLEQPLHDPFVYLKAAVRGELIVDPADLSSLENNLIVMEILDAARKSARTGKKVRLY